MTTRAVLAIHADCQSAMAAVQEAINLPEVVKEEHLSGREKMYERLDHWLGRMSSENIDGYIVGVGVVEGWTLIEEPQMIIPCDIEILKLISTKLCTTVGGYLIQTTSGSYGFIDCRNGQVVRNFLSVDGAVVHDEGQLDDEPPPLINDPWNGVERAWQKLIPTTDAELFEVRLFTSGSVAEVLEGGAIPVRHKKPWWKLF